MRLILIVRLYSGSSVRKEVGVLPKESLRENPPFAQSYQGFAENVNPFFIVQYSPILCPMCPKMCPEHFSAKK